MSDGGSDVAPIGFTYHYEGHGWAGASISNDQNTHYMHPSYVPHDPLFSLLRAVVEILRYGGEASFTWFYEPSADRWSLRREGDALYLTIRWFSDGFSYPNWPNERGKLHFSTTCDLWKFAAKVRLAASRLEPSGEPHDDAAWLRNTGEYRALGAFLEERKGTSKKPGPLESFARVDV